MGVAKCRENSSSRRLTRLLSAPKNGANFSGTEACLSISESIDALAKAINCFFQRAITPSARYKTQSDCSLVKRAVKLALDDLKEKHAGILLSARALKIRSYAPDLARSIAGLILSSNDPEFHEECLSLLGLQSTETEGEIVKDCIKEKIISVIDFNERKPQRSKQMAVAPSLFEDECRWSSNFQDEEYEEGEDEREDSFFLD